MAGEIGVMSLEYAGASKMKALRPTWRVRLLVAMAIGDMTKLEAVFLAVSSRLASVCFTPRARDSGRDGYV